MSQKGPRKSSSISQTARRAVILPLFICLIAMIPAFKQTFAWVDFKFSDLLFAYSPILRYLTGQPELPKHPVVIINKDQTFFQRFHRDPDRSDFAALTNFLQQQNAKVLAFDFIFSEPGESTRDQNFASALASFPLPILATHFIGRGTQTFEKIDLTDINANRPPWPTPVYGPLRSQAAEAGLINLVADYDSTLRFAPLAFHPSEMEEFLPSLGYSTYIAALIMQESNELLTQSGKHEKLENASPAQLLQLVIKAGKYPCRSTGHAGIDLMTRRLELLFISRLLGGQLPQIREQLLAAARSINLAELPATTWLKMPDRPLPLIGNYHMPCLRLAFSKLSPPLKGDGIPTLSMGTLLETEADKTSTLLHGKQLINIETGMNDVQFNISRPEALPGSKKISGKVTSLRQQPVSKAQLLFLMPEKKFWARSETDADGNFFLNELPAGDFTLQITQVLANGWQKASMRGKIEEEQQAMVLPDLIFATCEADLKLQIPEETQPLSSIALFGEPLPMIKSDINGDTGLNSLPTGYSIAGLDEDTEITFSSGKLLMPDGKAAPSQTAALLADATPWSVRFFYGVKPEPGQKTLTLSGLPTSLDARIALFSALATSSAQTTEDVTIFPGTENLQARLPAVTSHDEGTVTAEFACPDSEPVNIYLLSETGEKFTCQSNHSIALPSGKFLVLTEQKDRRGMYLPGSLSSSVVFFGSALPQDQDFIVTPINFMDRSFNRVPGVNLHANLFSALMRQSYLKATPAHSDISPDYWPLLQTLLLLPVLAALNIIFVKAGALWGGIWVIAAAILWAVAGIYLFLQQWLLPFFFPMLQLLSFGALRGYMSWIIARQQEKETRQTFGRFISPAVVEDILRTPDSLKPGGEKKELSIIFTDLAGFTSISEKLEPEQLTELMNEYLDEMTNILFQFGGTLDKYIGDAIMGFWNHPKAQPDHAQRSVDCAIHMQKRLAILREKWIKQGLPKVEVRAGMNSAVCMVGFIGSHIQMNFTCLGDGVNLASRLEGANKAYGTFIMIAESVHRQIDRDSISTRFLDFLAVKGKEKPMEVFEVRGYRKDEPPEWLEAEGLYKEGIRLYLARDWDKAIATFARVIELLPADGPSGVYSERCREFKKTPPPENWDGRYILKSK